jgi:hypothetical protein
MACESEVRLSYGGSWLFDSLPGGFWRWTYLSDCGLVTMQSENFTSREACLEDARAYGYREVA